ncbi:cysteine desulfurase family protein, partial [Methylophaga sp.]|uniref:cysteine desulfurase family protein n=1 Tax=Methylophaga sp. TaxID=2024840 RepID=UPI003F6A253B
MKVGNSIYMDYQASTPVDQHVKAAMLSSSELFFANPHSTQHHFGQQSAETVDKAREQIETVIKAKKEEVIFTSGATESNNHAIASVLFTNANTKRKTLLISAIEHKCIKNAAYFYGNKLGYEVKEIPVLSDGLIDMKAYQSMLSEEVVLVCIMAVNNEIGVIQDVKSLTKLAHQFGALFHCDAAQAPEAIDIDVQYWQVDMLSLSGHKIYGPKGVGVLYIKNALQAQLPPLIHGGGQQGGARSGTLPTELCVGMAEALMLTAKEAFKNRTRLAELKNA